MTDAHQIVLLFVAVVKRWLEDELPVANRVYMLEWLASYDKAPITPAVVAGVQPADDVTMEIVSEAIRLSISANDDGQAMFAVLERPDVLGLLRQCQ